MESLNFLMEYPIPIVVGVCLCLGYIIKNILPAKTINKYIPLIMAAAGVLLNVWIRKEITPQILLAGMYSGLASTGLHQAFVHLLEGKGDL